MSISGIPPTSNPYPAPAALNRNQFRTNFNDLANALNGGDLSAAQSAFAALQQSQPSSSTSSANPIGSQTQNPLSADIAALGKALQSGDLSSAQDAFKKVQQDVKSGHGHHHHKHAGGVQSAPAATEIPGTTDPLSNGQVGVNA